MQFTSLAFFIFFVIVYGLYLILTTRRQNQLLLVASYIFYGSWDWRFVPLLFFSTWISYYSGIKIAQTSISGLKQHYLWLALTAELGILAIFKYFNFFTANVIECLELLGIQAPHVIFEIALPLGISYYTFQAMAYTIDVYRGNQKPSHDFMEFALFKSFFPILFGGPIERASNLLAQITKKREINSEHLKHGLYLIGWGLFKKIFIADHVGPIADDLFNHYQSLSGLETWIAAYAFAIQIYCDFSGYTDIARGLGKLMGFDLAINFNLPYLATNPVDFWRRWHISLTSWFGDYVFNPLFFLTKNVIFSLFVTLLLVGVWHGASWNFLVLGIYNGIIFCSYMLIEPRLRPFLRLKSSNAQRFVNIFSVVVMFHLTCLSFIIFRSPSLIQIGTMQKLLFTGSYSLTATAVGYLSSLAFFVLPLAAMEYFQARSRDSYIFLKLPKPAQVATILSAFWLIVLVCLFTSAVGDGHREFIYFHF